MQCQAIKPNGENCKNRGSRLANAQERVSMLMGPDICTVRRLHLCGIHLNEMNRNSQLRVRRAGSINFGDVNVDTYGLQQ